MQQILPRCRRRVGCLVSELSEESEAWKEVRRGTSANVSGMILSGVVLVEAVIQHFGRYEALRSLDLRLLFSLCFCNQNNRRSTWDPRRFHRLCGHFNLATLFLLSSFPSSFIFTPYPANKFRRTSRSHSPRSFVWVFSIFKKDEY